MQDLIYIKVCAAVRRGVFTTEQWAAMIGHCYPFYPLLESVFDALAAACLEPTVQDILASASTIPMTEEMQLFDDYIVHITDWYHHEYIPVPRVESSSKPAFPGPSKSAASLLDVWLY